MKGTLRLLGLQVQLVCLVSVVLFFQKDVLRVTFTTTTSTSTTTSSNYNYNYNGYGTLDRSAGTLNCSLQGENFSIPYSIPSFIILGSQKGGTSALGELLELHPRILRTNGFEGWFFHSKFNLKRMCPIRNRYVNQFFNLSIYQQRSSSSQSDGAPILTFEKSPSYLPDPLVAERLRTIFPDPDRKLIASLRDPTLRLFSAFLMDKDRNRIATHLGPFVEQQIELLRERNLTRAPTLNAFLEKQYQEEDFDDLPDLETYRTAVMDNTYLNRIQYFQFGMYSRHLKVWSEHYSIGSDLKVVQYESMKNDMQRTFSDILQFVGAEDLQLDDSLLQQDRSPASHAAVKGRYPNRTLDFGIEQYLRRFYRPYNTELADILGKEWRQIWDK